ncbi:MAG TPA: hypothetical protein VFG28_14400 [Syntrophales bacterium]|nr:hypothetical protein [Syntrophales bacterium]
MKLWETYFRLWQKFSESLTEGTTQSLNQREFLQNEESKSTPERDIYRDCGEYCFEDFGM